MCVRVVCVDAKGGFATVAFQAASVSVLLPFSLQVCISLHFCPPPSLILDLITSPSPQTAC